MPASSTPRKSMVSNFTVIGFRQKNLHFHYYASNDYNLSISKFRNTAFARKDCTKEPAMKNKMVHIACFIMFSLIVIPAIAAEEQASAEYRMTWILTLEGELTSTAAGIKKAVDACRESNINAIIPVVRRRGRTYYKSNIEPFYNPDPEHPLTFDPLEEFIKNAHDTSGGKYRIEVHAWVVVAPVWLEEQSPPAGHVLLEHPRWMTLHHDYEKAKNQKQSWLDFGVPAVEEYMAGLCAELVKKYDIDGLNLDYIRYRQGGYGYNPVAVQRFQERYNRTARPAPDDKEWNEWRREQVTNLLKRIYVATKKIDPTLKVSACTITWGSIEQGFTNTRAYMDCSQDWVSWMEHDLLDINIPMNYKKESDPSLKKSYREWMQFMVEHEDGGLSVSGMGSYLNTIEGAIAQIQAARALDADGTAIFRLAVNNNEDKPWQALLTKLENTIYSSPAPIPECVPLKKREYGILNGTVTTMKGAVDGEELTLTLLDDNSVEHTTHTSGTGFYAFFKVPKGKYTLESSHYGTLKKSVKVKAGKIVTKDIRVSFIEK